MTVSLISPIMGKASLGKDSSKEDRRKLLQGLGHTLYLTTIRKGEGFTTTLELIDDKKGGSVFTLLGSADSKDDALKVDFKISEDEALRLVVRVLEALGARKD